MISHQYIQDDMLSNCCEEPVNEDDLCMMCGKLSEPFEDDPKDYAEDAYKAYKNEEIHSLPNYEP